MAFFIAVEGIDGAGKSTQVELLARRIRKACAIPLVVLHEPGSTALGEYLRPLIKGEISVPLAAPAELLLIAAARAQLVAERIKPFLDKGGGVLCDRFSGSTWAYQGYGRGLDRGLIRAVENFSNGGVQPDCVVLLDLEVKTALFRKRDMLRLDRFEAEDVHFYQRVRKGYLELSATLPEVWRVVDGAPDPQTVAAAVWAAVEPVILKGNKG